MSVKSYDDPENIVLSDFSNPAEFVQDSIAKGIIGGWQRRAFKFEV